MEEDTNNSTILLLWKGWVFIVLMKIGTSWVAWGVQRVSTLQVILWFILGDILQIIFLKRQTITELHRDNFFPNSKTLTYHKNLYCVTCFQFLYLCPYFSPKDISDVHFTNAITTVTAHSYTLFSEKPAVFPHSHLNVERTKLSWDSIFSLVQYFLKLNLK